MTFPFIFCCCVELRRLSITYAETDFKNSGISVARDLLMFELSNVC